MNKLIILILCLFSFLPFVNAEDYSNYDIVEVEELPTASADTLNKLFKVNGVYYVTESQEGNYTAIPLNENLNGKTLYFNFPDDLYIYIRSTYSSLYSKFADVTGGSWHIYLDNNQVQFRAPRKSSNVEYLYTYSSSLNVNLTEYTISEDIIVTQIYDEYINSLISLTPFEVTYAWKIVSSYELGTFDIPDQDFYLFFDFDTIKGFDIFSSFNFDSFTDYEKLNITLLLNIFFGLFIFLIIYISLKAIYKFASMII